MRMVSIGALVITLLILALIALLRIMASGLEQNFKENLSFDLELPSQYNQESYEALQNEIKAIPGILSCQYISADSALKMVTEREGENPVNILGYNPMRARVSLQLRSEYLNTDSLAKLKPALSYLGLDTDYLQDDETTQLQKVESNFSLIEWLLWGFVVIQAIFTFVQISNTTRMAIYAQRLQIRTLTLVGASAWFIRKPLVIRSLLDGFIASMVSLSIIAGLIALVHYTTELQPMTILNPLHLMIASGGLLTIALVASALASYRSAQRYIKMDGKKIHLV